MWLSGLASDTAFLVEETWVSIHEEPGRPAFEMWQGKENAALRLRYTEGTSSVTFVIDADGEHVWATWTASVTLTEVANLLLGPVLGYVLRQRGTLCLHANALALGDQAFLILGAKGAGKSTTTLALARQGCAVLADDMAVLGTLPGGAVCVQPGPPRLRLCADTVAFYNASAATPVWPQVEDAHKSYLYLDEAGLDALQVSLPLRAIYVLTPGADAETARVDRVRGAMSLPALLPHLYAADGLDATAQARIFNQLSHLVRRVPVRTIKRPHGLSRLPALCTAIMDDIDHVVSATSPPA